MKTTKKIAKHAFLRTLKLAGAFHSLLESRWRHERLLILCYHGISLEDEHEWRPTSHMTRSVLESRLETLRTGGYSVLPLEGALRQLSTHTLGPKSVAITFDDGLYNFYTHAFPLLQKYNYPATLYLTTYYSDHQWPVFPLICSYMLWKKRGTVVPVNTALGLSRSMDLTTASGRSLAEEDIRAYTEKMNLDAHQKNEWVKRLAQHLELDFDRLVSERLFHLMTPEEVKEVSQKGVDIQLHTHRHCSPLDRRLYQREISENRDKIVQFTGKQARHFCYPSGVYKPPFLPWLAEQAVSSATTCDPGLADAKTNLFLLPRFLDSSNVSALEFESWLTGIAPFLRQNLYGQ